MRTRIGIGVWSAIALMAGVAWMSPTSAQLAPLTVERVRLSRAPEIDVGDRIATVVRVDLRHYAFRFLTESHDGPRRPAPAWVRDHGLVGAINAGMFLPNGTSCGYLRAAGEVRSARRPARFDAVIAFDPRAEGAPPFAVGGTGCGSDLEGTIASHDSVLQGARMIVDCEGRAQRRWRTGRYSAALVGTDREGRAVLVHVRTPYRMQVLAQMLAEPAMNLRGLVYMEGGPEASLWVEDGATRVREMGSWEDGFHEADDLHDFWDLPNVVAFARRGAAR